MDSKKMGKVEEGLWEIGDLFDKDTSGIQSYNPCVASFSKKIDFDKYIYFMHGMSGNDTKGNSSFSSDKGKYIARVKLDKSIPI